jgi:Raf kinase inhibitor-like YbhB/YbcL family protein
VVLIDESFDFVHYVVHDIPHEVTALSEGASDDEALPEGAIEVPAYGGGPYHGPCPPAGPNTYAFRVYALDRIQIEFGASGRLGQRDLDDAFAEHTLAVAHLRATCERP